MVHVCVPWNTCTGSVQSCTVSGVVCVRAHALHTNEVTSYNHMTQSVTTTVDNFAMSPELDARSARTRSDKMSHL